MSTSTVVVFGSSRCQEGDADWQLAYESGQVLGERGLRVVSGGYEGTMGAVSRGTREAGGQVVGITTRIFADRTPNPHLHEHVELEDYPTRLARLLRSGDAYLALPGALGTASEWVSAWCLATIGQLSGPLWIYEHAWRDVADSLLRLHEVDPALQEHLRWLRGVDDLADAVDAWRA